MSDEMTETDAETPNEPYEPGAEYTFAEHALLALDRLDRQVDVLRDQMRTADDYLRRVMMSDPVAVGPTRVRVLNKNVQSVGVTVDRLPTGEIAVIVTHRGDEDAAKVVQPNEIYDREVEA